ncbi:ABA4-like family protein [Porphyrobacter sp. GA68]|uniref:ABA4-like family protein n=1 Tax=Porphyrobacter sp. GA68 TaxID=2883480 RepID=UPI001D191143|nr:ABA4-like family protein [Porphyrobacter sp. GA68]
MTWPLVFNLANGVAIVMWLILIFLPRREIVLTLVLYAGIGLLCLAYTAGVAGVLSGVWGGEASGADFTTIAGVRAIFSTDGGVTIGWIHYLAFDLFAGLWIARDADTKGWGRAAQAPVLLLTFVAGPAGLLAWLVLRGRFSLGGENGHRIRTAS